MSFPGKLKRLKKSKKTVDKKKIKEMEEECGGLKLAVKGKVDSSLSDKELESVAKKVEIFEEDLHKLEG